MKSAVLAEGTSRNYDEPRRLPPANEFGLECGQESGIPEDDGMRSLRAQLHQIRILAISTEERAQRMHGLMTKSYLAHLAQSDTSAEADDVTTPTNSSSNPYRLQSADLEATFSPLPATNASSPDETNANEEEDNVSLLGCIHYKRNVKIQCFDCQRWFPCRHCHDACKTLPFQHTLNRKKTENMLCMLCKTAQPAAEVCYNCGEYAAYYYCSKCKFWDNDSNKRIYHCDDCGLCRIGQGLGKDFVHCRRCNVCISISTSAAHPCIERATDSDCPLCLSYLFESQTPVVSLPCGHYMHGECYKDLMAVTYKCPVCNKSAVNMELQWRKLDDEIEAQPMPEDDQDLANLLPHVEGHTLSTEEEPVQRRRPRTVWIGCNDCGGRCYTPFHWLGLKCQVCGGYNTNQMAPPAGRESDTERVLRQQAQHCQHDFIGNFVLRDVGIGIVTDDEDDRVDSASGMSLSPPSDPTLVPRASRAHSPGRRYFLLAEEPRRSSFTTPSFTTPRFPTPSMPNLPTMAMPELPSLQDMALPSLPNMPSIELPRFSPYDMVAVISRSWSPMRYYREGLDRCDDFRRSMSRRDRRNSAPPGSLDIDEGTRATMPRSALRQNSLNVVPTIGNRHQQDSSAVESDDEAHIAANDDNQEDEDIFEGIIGHR